jgi:hypothetical protein
MPTTNFHIIFLLHAVILSYPNEHDHSHLYFGLKTQHHSIHKLLPLTTVKLAYLLCIKIIRVGWFKEIPRKMVPATEGRTFSIHNCREMYRLVIYICNTSSLTVENFSKCELTALILRQLCLWTVVNEALPCVSPPIDIGLDSHTNIHNSSL